MYRLELKWAFPASKHVRKCTSLEVNFHFLLEGDTPDPLSLEMGPPPQTSPPRCWTSALSTVFYSLIWSSNGHCNVIIKDIGVFWRLANHLRTIIGAGLLNAQIKSQQQKTGEGHPGWNGDFIFLASSHHRSTYRWRQRCRSARWCTSSPCWRTTRVKRRSSTTMSFQLTRPPYRHALLYVLLQY